MAYQYLYPDGLQDQNHTQCGSCDCCNRLASESIWCFRLPDGGPCIKLTFSLHQHAS